MKLEALLKAKEIFDKADVSREVSYSNERLMWTPDKGVISLDIKRRENLDVLRDRLSLYGFKLIA